MRNLKTRIQALEGRSLEGLRRWHRIIVGDGQTEAEARAAYEAENGKVAAPDYWIVRVVI